MQYYPIIQILSRPTFYRVEASRTIVPETVKVKVGEAVLTFLRVTNLLSLALSILFSHIQFYLFKLHVLLFM